MEFLKALVPEWDLAIISLILALILDIIYPEHKGIFLKMHPVHTSYIMALKLGKPHSGKLKGILIWILIVASHLIPLALILIITYQINQLLWILASAIILKLSFSLKLLLDICYKAYLSFKVGLDEARKWVQQIVRRDVYKLDEQRVISASIESLAESLVDGFTSPLFYYAFLGPLGAMLQRLSNTLDGAIGYKTPEYREVGWFSAKVDTVLNLIPARLTALMIALSSFIARGNINEAIRTWIKWNRATESLNAGHPISAMAGALEVRLEKPSHYVINADSRCPETQDIVRALRIAILVSSIWVIIAIALTMPFQIFLYGLFIR